MAENTADGAPGGINFHEHRAVGVALDLEQLRAGDFVNLVVEARMMNQPTGALLPVRNVVYQGVEDELLRFDTEIGEPHYFAPYEILRAELADV